MNKRLAFTAAIAFLMGAIVAAQAATLTVVQRGLMLNKSAVTIARGDRIVFNNEDDVIHNIHIFGPGSDEQKDLGLQKPGVPLNYTFDKVGSYRVRCNIHPSVKMAVTVQ
jgi:plastocyanin